MIPGKEAEVPQVEHPAAAAIGKEINGRHPPFVVFEPAAASAAGPGAFAGNSSRQPPVDWTSTSLATMLPPDATLLFWAFLALCALFVGLSKTGIPGLSILVVPLIASVIDPRASVGLMLPMLLVGDLFAITWYRRHTDWRRVAILLPWALVGLAAGYVVLDRVDSVLLGRILGGIVLLLLLLHGWMDWRGGAGALNLAGHRWIAPLAGVAAGATTMVANAGGPVMILYLLAMRLEKNSFLGTGAWFFFTVNLLKVFPYMHLGLITADSATINLQLAPVVAAGAVAGIVALRFIPQRAFEMSVRVLALLAAVRLLAG